MWPHHKDAVEQVRKLLTLFRGKHLSHPNGDNFPATIRSFPFKFHTYPSTSAAISMLTNKQGFDLSLMKQQRLYKCKAEWYKQIQADTNDTSRIWGCNMRIWSIQTSTTGKCYFFHNQVLNFFVFLATTIVTVLKQKV